MGIVDVIKNKYADYRLNKINELENNIREEKVKKCPGNAIIEKGSLEEGNLETRIIKDLCHGCTICMKDCSFNKRGYSQIKNIFEK